MAKRDLIRILKEKGPMCCSELSTLLDNRGIWRSLKIMARDGDLKYFDVPYSMSKTGYKRVYYVKGYKTVGVKKNEFSDSRDL